MDPELLQFIEKQKEIVLTAYEQAKSYSNIVMMGGYAGLFAIWSFTKEQLVKWQVIAVGLLALLSVLLFVLFEIYGMWLRSVQTFTLLKQLAKAGQMNKFPDDYGKQERERAESLSRIWPFFFFGALISGLAAAAILLWAFVQKLVCY
jgi:hypothetical protein